MHLLVAPLPGMMISSRVGIGTPLGAQSSPFCTTLATPAGVGTILMTQVNRLHRAMRCALLGGFLASVHQSSGSSLEQM
jgi:hypothetical protein